MEMDDERGYKVAVVAHCILNQNAKVAKYARYKGVVKEIVNTLIENGYGFLQLPCPENTYMGMSRWWQVRNQYDNPAYRRHSLSILQPVLDQIEEFHKMGCKILLIGIDGSPSCGINLTGLNEEWYGEPRHLEYRKVERPGVFRELLEEQMEKKGIIFEKVGLPLDVDGDLEKPLKQLKKVL